MASMSSSSFPAGPTKGSPRRSSCSPGPSPMNMSSAFSFPTPKTSSCRVSHSEQPRQAAHSRFKLSQESIVPPFPKPSGRGGRSTCKNVRRVL